MCDQIVITPSMTYGVSGAGLGHRAVQSSLQSLVFEQLINARSRIVAVRHLVDTRQLRSQFDHAAQVSLCNKEPSGDV